MMAATAIMTFFWEVFICPFTSIMILVNCWVWVKFFVEDWDSRNFSVSYSDLVKKKQWWRVLSAPISHTSVWHLMLNVLVIWNCRLTELNLGTWFVFRYSLVLAVSESILTCALIKATIKYSPIGSTIEPMLTSTNAVGCSGILMGWLTFQSMLNSTYAIKKHFVLFGLLSFPQEFSLLFMAIIYYWLLPRHNLISNLTGLVSGYLLVSGLVQIIPDLFWSICFVLNIALLVLSSLVSNQTNALLPRSVSDTGGELVEVQSYEDSTLSGGAISVSSRSRVADYRADDLSADLEAGTRLLDGIENDDNDSDISDNTLIGNNHGAATITSINSPVGVASLRGNSNRNLNSNLLQLDDTPL